MPYKLGEILIVRIRLLFFMKSGVILASPGQIVLLCGGSSSAAEALLDVEVGHF